MQTININSVTSFQYNIFTLKSLPKLELKSLPKMKPEKPL
jgi:hypothetical protein